MELATHKHFKFVDVHDVRLKLGVPELYHSQPYKYRSSVVLPKTL